MREEFSGFRLISEKVTLSEPEIGVLKDIERNIIKGGCQVSARLPFIDNEPIGNSGIYIENDHIISLFLYHEVMKQIPKSIGSLQYLKNLYIIDVVHGDSENISLNGTLLKIPDSIQDLSSLSTLFIRGQGIDHWDNYKLPKSFSKLKSLTTLVLEGILHFPEFIKDLKSLRHLQLNDTYIAEILPDQIDLLRNLKTLNLERNPKLQITTKGKNLLQLLESNGCIITPNLDLIHEIISPRKMTEAELVVLVEKAVKSHKNDHTSANGQREKNLIEIIETEATNVQLILRMLNDISEDRTSNSDSNLGKLTREQLIIKSQDHTQDHSQIDKIEEILNGLNKLKIASFERRKEISKSKQVWFTYWWIDLDQCWKILM